MKTLGRLVLLVILLAIIGGVVFYKRPVWVGMQQTHLSLLMAHVQSNYVLTPEGRVHYYEGEASTTGGGIPIVLIHGIADRDESWALMIKRLKRAGFHVYAPDLLGYGRSPKPANSDYSISTQEQFVADFIQAIGLQKPDIGGWSMGGWVVLKLALDHPDMVNRVVVYDAAGIRFDGAADRASLFHPSTTAEINDLFRTMEPELKYPFPDYIAKDLLRALQNEAPTADKSMASMQSGVDALDTRLPTLTQPLLIVWGSVDHLLPLSVGQKMHALVPSSELDVVEGCGHLAPKTCSNRVAAATADFLKAKPAPTGQTRTLANMH
jgi:pimeloyl-ACP methyl ester carboxylesterase